MDEREVREVLTNAADALTPSLDLAARAELRYRRRRARARAASVAVVIAVVGSGVATAAIVSRKTTSTLAGPAPTRQPKALGAVDVKSFGALAFVDATTGYGVASAGGQSVLAKTDDGARTWRAVSLMPTAAYRVALAPHAAGQSAGVIVWGQAGISVTNDDGAHWRTTLRGAVADVVASPDRVWATAQCLSSERCHKLMVSADGGLSWKPASAGPLYIGAVAVSAKAATVAFFVELGDKESKQWAIDGTNDGLPLFHGRWSTLPTPCPDSGNPHLAVGGDGKSLMLVCTVDSRARVFVSGDQGRKWTQTVPLPGGRFRALSAWDDSDSTFVVGLGSTVGPPWDKGPLTYPVLDQWAWTARPQPIGDVRAFSFVRGAVLYFAASTGVYYEHSGVRELRAPAPTTGSFSTTTTTSATTPTSGKVNTVRIRSTSFVDAHVGYGIDTLRQTAQLVRTDDGGRTWTRVSAFAEGQPFVHFESVSHGVEWGVGPLQVTTDGGVHWFEPKGGGPVDNSLAWADGRLWAISPCVQSLPCGSAPMLISDDAGVTWHRAGVIRQGSGGASILATSRSTAYEVEPASDQQQITGWRVAVTNDGGSSWRYEPMPCGTLAPILAGNGPTLLLICAQGPTATQDFKVYTSSDRGRTWSSQGQDPFVGGYFGTLTNVGSTFVAAMRRGEIWSSPDGKTWHRGTNVGEGFWSVDPVPGAGVWAANEDAPDNANSGIWFSADGERWRHL